MKYESEVLFRCDHCRKNITNKKHIRILMGSVSGWMVPPFFGGVPVVSISDRKPEYHFDIPECFTAYFVEKLNAIRTDTRGNEVDHSISPIKRKMLEEFGTPRSRVSGEDNVGARDSLSRSESERAVGDSDVVRVGALGRGNEEADQRVDSNQSNEKSRRTKISAFRLGAKKVLSKLNLRKA